MHTCKIKTLTINTWAVGVGNRWLGFPIKSWRVTRHKTIAYKNCSPSWKSHGWHRIGRKGLKYHSSQLQLETQGFYSNLGLGKANTSNSHNSIHRSRNEMASLHQLFKKVGWRLVQSLISWSGSLWICDSIPGAERQNLRNKSPFNSVWPETRREFDAGYKLEPRPRPGWHDAKIRLTNTLPAIGNTALLPWHGCRMQSDQELSREGERVLKSCHYPPSTNTVMPHSLENLPGQSNHPDFIRFLFIFSKQGFLWISLWKSMFCCCSFPCLLAFKLCCLQ